MPRQTQGEDAMPDATASDAERLVPRTGTRRRFIKGGAAAVAGLGALRAGPARGAQREIKIGYVSPRTGPLAGFGEADEFILAGLEQAFKDGVAIGGKRHPIKLLVKDSQSNPNRAAEVASDLILNGKIDLMLVASTPETTNPVADQCELNEMPCVSSIAPWQPWFFGRGGDPAKGFKWTYHFFWGLEDIIGVFTDLWQAVPTNKKVEALGAVGEGLTTEVWWSPNHPFKSSLTGASARDLAAAYTNATKKQWTQPMGFIHALFEVAFDALSRSGKAGDREALREAIKATTKKTIVGDISWAKGPVGNVAKTPLVGGQWGKGKQFAYDLTIVNNKRAPLIPTSGTLRGMV